jgi:hypothetical protein
LSLARLSLEMRFTLGPGDVRAVLMIKPGRPQQVAALSMVDWRRNDAGRVDWVDRRSRTAMLRTAGAPP